MLGGGGVVNKTLSDDQPANQTTTDGVPGTQPCAGGRRTWHHRRPRHTRTQAHTHAHTGAGDAGQLSWSPCLWLMLGPTGGTGAFLATAWHLMQPGWSPASPPLLHTQRIAPANTGFALNSCGLGGQVDF